MVVDLGTGDGRFVLRTAREDPHALVIGVDADAGSMVEASRKAHRGRLSNAMFVVASVESLPWELEGVANDVRIQFPWGSLLRGITQADEAIVRPLARACAPDARITALISVVERDRRVAAGFPADPWMLGQRFAEQGLRLVEVRAATEADIEAAHSSWAKRLGAGSARPVTLMRWRR